MIDIYLLTFIILLVGLFIPPKVQKLSFWFYYLLLLFLASFRDVYVGTDTLTYQEYFYRIKDFGFISYVEPGWNYLNHIIGVLNGSFQWVLIATSFLVLTPVFIVVKKQSVNRNLSIFLFFAFYLYFQSFNIMRQAIAISFIFIAFNYLSKKKYLFFVLGVLFASLFHTSALMCLPFVFIHKLPDRRTLWILIIFSSYIIGSLLTAFLLPQLGDLLGYSSYLMSFGEKDSSGAGLYLILANLFSIFIILTSQKSSSYLKLFLLFPVMLNLIEGIPYGYRLRNYFVIILIIYLPYYLYNNTLSNRTVGWIVVFLFSLVTFIRFYGDGGIFPYVNVLF